MKGLSETVLKLPKKLGSFCMSNNVVFFNHTAVTADADYSYINRLWGAPVFPLVQYLVF